VLAKGSISYVRSLDRYLNPGPVVTFAFERICAFIRDLIVCSSTRTLKGAHRTNTFITFGWCSFLIPDSANVLGVSFPFGYLFADNHPPTGDYNLLVRKCRRATWLVTVGWRSTSCSDACLFGFRETRQGFQPLHTDRMGWWIVICHRLSVVQCSKCLIIIDQGCFRTSAMRLFPGHEWPDTCVLAAFVRFEFCPRERRGEGTRVRGQWWRSC